ncbi:MAG: serine/threonine protein kinase [Pseudomonadota bacterium]
MNPTKLIAALLAGAALSACGSGDINISPSTVSNTTNNGGGNGGSGGPSSVCGNRTVGSQVISGTEDGNGNCLYDSVFVGPNNNLTEDLLLRALPNGGAHIFDTSLFVGETYRTQAALAANGIFEGGDGPTLTIEAGTTLAFTDQRNFLIINRGSQIIANGTADAPITLTSLTDVNGTVGPEDVQQWGGVVINGFGISNKCEYNDVPRYAGGPTDRDSGTNPNLALGGGTECAIEAEGSAGDDESQYGGINNEDDSGSLRYVIVKHTGAQVGNGDELNGISFGGVGRGTLVENLQVYSTFDDGIEMFGGSLDITNFVAVYARDDSIDIDEGWDGVLTNALVIQQEENGNHCIEADGVGSYDSFSSANNNLAALQQIVDNGFNSRPVINNLTCIVSPNFPGTHDPGAGWRFREGIYPIVQNALLISSFGVNDPTGADDNYCLRFQSDETLAAADAGIMQINSAIVACQEVDRGAVIGTFNGERAWMEANSSQFATVASGTAIDASENTTPELALLDGDQNVFSTLWASSAVDGAVPAALTEPTAIEVGGTAPTFLGAVEATNDWTSPWVYGISPDNRGQALWFE